MSGTHRRPGGRTARPTTKKKTTRSKSAPSPDDGHVCSESGCTKVCKTAAGLASHRRQAHKPAPVALPPELPTVAAERLLASIKIPARLALLVATIRQLAKALEECETTDKAKISKELTARVSELLGDPVHTPDEPDWTEDEE